MPVLFAYLFKLSLSLGAVYLFYQLLLRKLTFYNWNRWYLLGYTFLSLFIPFINISPVLEKNQWSGNNIVQWVPAIDTFSPGDAGTVATTTNSTGSFTAWSILVLLFMIGAAIMLFRLVAQLFSFNRMIKKATLISAENTKIFQVDDTIIPFSFGNAIYINRNLHTENELEEIIRHEFVHVRQRHTIDIIWAELLCLFNWYNPFAWLLKASIRQNLEFIADHKVLENGINKKHYQYLLLKVIGNHQFSIASPFNFSSLKKRIAMMNKLKTAKVHAVKFLFVLPVFSVMLLAFRKDHEAIDPKPVIRITSQVIDRETREPLQDVRILNPNTGRVAITDARGYYMMEIPADQPVNVEMSYSRKGYKEFTTRPLSLQRKDNQHSINLVEVVEMLKGKMYEPCKDCGSSVLSKADYDPSSGYKDVKEFALRLKAVVRDTVPNKPVVAEGKKLGYDMEITDKKATIFLKDGTVEKYDLTNPEQKKKFEENYGQIITLKGVQAISPATGNTIMITPTTVTGVNIQAAESRPLVKGVNVGVAENVQLSTTIAPVTVINGTSIASTSPLVATQVAPSRGLVALSDVSHAVSGTTIISPVTSVVNGEGVSIIGDENLMFTGDVKILGTITKKTTKEELEKLKKQLKEQGCDLDYTDIQYDKNGILIYISGTIDSKNGRSNFVADDFERVVFSMLTNGERQYFRFQVKGKEII